AGSGILFIRVVQEGPAVRRGREALDFAAKLLVPRAQGLDTGGALRLRSIQRLVEDRFHPLPVLGGLPVRHVRARLTLRLRFRGAATPSRSATLVWPSSARCRQ